MGAELSGIDDLDEEEEEKIFLFRDQ